jgi:hypothetical protein
MRYIIIPALLLALCAPMAAEAAPVPQKNPVFPIKARGEAKAVVVSKMPSVGLYTYTFSLTATGEDVYLPKGASRNAKDMSAGVLYDIFESDEGARAAGASGAFVHSNASTSGNTYVVPKGKTETFTLVAAHNNRGIETDNYHMRIVGLRYAVKAPTNALILESNGFAGYKTKEVELVK